jgi:hypothetical protein
MTSKAKKREREKEREKIIIKGIKFVKCMCRTYKMVVKLLQSHI